MTGFDRVAIASRVFSIAAILGLVLLAADPALVVSLVVVATVGTTAIYLSMVTPLPSTLVVTVEAAVTSLVIALALPGAVILLPYLVALALVAGLTGGIVGLSAIALIQHLAIFLIAIVLEGADAAAVYRSLSPWLLTGIGAGLLGVWLLHAGKVPQGNDLTHSYESAHRLLTQLRTVARRLSSGLDPVTMGAYISDDVVAELGAQEALVFVRTDGGVLSLLSDSSGKESEATRPLRVLAEACWTEMEPVVRVDGSGQQHVVALPLRVASRMAGVVVATLPEVPRGGSVAAIMRRLDEQSLRLETALVFDEIRRIATVEERSRLAREIHDGIAQEVASLGYLVDGLIASAESRGQRADLETLRKELSRVVSELRLSIFDLRSDVRSEAGLGSALSTYVREISTRSHMTVHLTLDEAPTRLRIETETELLRMAQEAITNARKHSGAENLWVDCRVAPPLVLLEVRDDGFGLGTGRSDSYGLRIIRERAHRLNARLEIRPAFERVERPGTLVRIRLGNDPSFNSRGENVPAGDAPEPHHRSARGRPRLDPSGSGQGVRAV